MARWPVPHGSKPAASPSGPSRAFPRPHRPAQHRALSGGRRSRRLLAGNRGPSRSFFLAGGVAAPLYCRVESRAGRGRRAGSGDRAGGGDRDGDGRARAGAGGRGGDRGAAAGADRHARGAGGDHRPRLRRAAPGGRLRGGGLRRGRRRSARRPRRGPARRALLYRRHRRRDPRAAGGGGPAARGGRLRRPGRGRRDHHLRADAPLQDQGARHRRDRRGDRSAGALPPPRPARRPREHLLSRHHGGAAQAGDRGPRPDDRRGRLPGLRPRAGQPRRRPLQHPQHPEADRRDHPRLPRPGRRALRDDRRRGRAGLLDDGRRDGQAAGEHLPRGQRGAWSTRWR